MKVLFAVSNESISESIVKKYQKDYKEIISYKNVYYFNAILKEIERDKSYDRIVISEDLEPFANNNYETIDRFLFERLDGISDEALNGEGSDTPIILICTDRRSKSDSILLKLFSIGIYNAIIGQDRSIDEVCNLINKPRTKKEAKAYYKIEADDANYQSEDEDSVSEAEIQNIITHYKKLGKNSDRFVESFDNIAEQYTDQQLKIIVKFLPLNVKAVLEESSPKYQEIMAFSNGKKKAPVKVKANPNAVKKQERTPKLENVKIDLLENQEERFEPKSNVIIPGTINTKNVKKAPETETKSIDLAELEDFEDLEPISEDIEETVQIEEEPIVEPVKKGRGRPKKTVIGNSNDLEEMQKKGRGRPKKESQIEGIYEPEEIEEVEIEPIEEIEPLEEPIEEINQKNIDEIKPIDLFSLSEEQEPEMEENINTRDILNAEENFQNVNIAGLLSKDKKIVSFVGAPKNGTSFLVNNLAFQLAQMGVNTAILDATKNKNSYYIYTRNEEQLRKTAFECMDKLKAGVAEGIAVNKNLTVYTSLPDKEKTQDRIQTILSTLVKKHSLVLVDCDFETNKEYFGASQEIYLVQSMDILTIQPLTAFLRDLKSKNILNSEKLRVVINKELKVKGLNPKVLIGGMSFYNEPAMTFMTELFNKDNIKYCTIPFEIENYSKYLEAIVDCNISINSYSKTFIANLKSLANLVYPLISRQTYESTAISNNYGNSSDTKVKRLFKFNK